MLQRPRPGAGARALEPLLLLLVVLVVLLLGNDLAGAFLLPPPPQQPRAAHPQQQGGRAVRMMAKKVSFGDKGLDQLVAGINVVGNAVKVSPSMSIAW